GEQPAEDVGPDPPEEVADGGEGDQPEGEQAQRAHDRTRRERGLGNDALGRRSDRRRGNWQGVKIAAERGETVYFCILSRFGAVLPLPHAGSSFRPKVASFCVWQCWQPWQPCGAPIHQNPTLTGCSPAVPYSRRVTRRTP